MTNVAYGIYCHHHHHHHHHVHEGLGVFPVPCSSRCSWSLHLFLGRPMFLRSFGWYFSACAYYLCPSSVHVVSTFPYTAFFLSFFNVFRSAVFSLIRWFFSLSSFVIPSKCLKTFICAASKRCFSLFFSTQASLPSRFPAKRHETLWC